ncbi:MAG: hypothetical protein U5O39_02750 [Gammaproteobacteria bacterium]|nr:hypothetical protein [Gammaproteobacteria bacterium]
MALIDRSQGYAGRHRCLRRRQTVCSHWLGGEPGDSLRKRRDPCLSEGESRSLLLLFFAAAVAMPHVYHILLTENDDEQLLSASRWGFPVYMLHRSALCVPPIVWGATSSSRREPMAPEYFTRWASGLPANSAAITILGLRRRARRGQRRTDRLDARTRLDGVEPRAPAVLPTDTRHQLLFTCSSTPGGILITGDHPRVPTVINRLIITAARS